MAEIGYHASHEQFKPGELLRYVQLAEQAGFKAVNCLLLPESENKNPGNRMATRVLFNAPAISRIRFIRNFIGII